MSMAWTALHSSLITSTVWREPDHVRIVWITMLALANKHGIVEASVPGLADVARVSLDNCVDAIERLSKPDTWSRTQEHEGRRIEAVDGGWVLLNFPKHRAETDVAKRREYQRQWQSEYRRRQKMSTLTLADPHRGETETETKNRKPKKASCAEPSKATDSTPAAEPVLVFPCVGGKSWNLQPEKLAQWAESFPGIDVMAECRKARQWLFDNPKKGKTYGGMTTFVGSWLGRAQNDAGRNGAGPRSATKGPSRHGPRVAVANDSTSYDDILFGKKGS